MAWVAVAAWLTAKIEAESRSGVSFISIFSIVSRNIRNYTAGIIRSNLRKCNKEIEVVL